MKQKLGLIFGLLLATQSAYAWNPQFSVGGGFWGGGGGGYDPGYAGRVATAQWLAEQERIAQALRDADAARAAAAAQEQANKDRTAKALEGEVASFQYKEKLKTEALERGIRSVRNILGLEVESIQDKATKAEKSLDTFYVYSQLSPEALEFLKNELSSAKYLANTALDGANSLEALSSSSMVIAIAGSTVDSVGRFLQGLQNGVWKGYHSLESTMAAIYNDPTLVTVVSYQIMDFLTAHPVHHFTNYVKDAYRNFKLAEVLENTKEEIKQGWNFFSTAPAEKIGEVFGEHISDFAGNVLLAVAGGEAAIPVKNGLKGVGLSLKGNGKALSRQLAQEIEKHPLFTEQVKVVQTQVQTITPELRKGVALLREHNLPLKYRRDVIEAFTEESKVIKLPLDTPVKRYWKEGESKPRGGWVTTELLENPQKDLALKYPGPYNLHEWMAPAGTEVIDGLVAPNFGQPGGAPQMFIPNPEVLK